MSIKYLYKKIYTYLRFYLVKTKDKWGNTPYFMTNYCLSYKAATPVTHAFSPSHSSGKNCHLSTKFALSSIVNYFPRWSILCISQDSSMSIYQNGLYVCPNRVILFITFTYIEILQHS